MLHISIGIGIGYWYQQWPILLDIRYWVAFLVSF